MRGMGRKERREWERWNIGDEMRMRERGEGKEEIGERKEEYSIR
jgi:hypothetical protein